MRDGGEGQIAYRIRREAGRKIAREGKLFGDAAQTPENESAFLIHAEFPSRCADAVPSLPVSADQIITPPTASDPYIAEPAP